MFGYYTRHFKGPAFSDFSNQLVYQSLPVANPELPTAGGFNPKGGAATLLFWPIFPKKMDENEKKI